MRQEGAEEKDEEEEEGFERKLDASRLPQKRE